MINKNGDDTNKGDLNKATVQELADLPLMNQMRARMVIDARDRIRHPFFRKFMSEAELTGITGINDRMAARIKEHYEIKYEDRKVFDQYRADRQAEEEANAKAELDQSKQPAASGGGATGRKPKNTNTNKSTNTNKTTPAPKTNKEEEETA